ncbi:glycosyltransferase [Streptomyces yaizuensis]|uniref:Glycosyltransferase n=1 Tax=Streptomyces yaizuensis TaxID=2989713 RepID=A0ABQ5NQS1_9ACTN|nr:hypothetical protein [Streptomyces sp. YSPA8]GLF92727.1 glycosyltransferase [Streptomyces sp. YSPA8]
MTSEPGVTGAAPGAAPPPRAPLRPGPAVPLNEPLPPRGPERRRQGEPLVLRHLRSMIARGFSPAPSWSVPVRQVFPDGTVTGSAREAARVLRAAGGNGGGPALALIAPTCVGRDSLAGQQRRLDGVLERVAELTAAHPGVPVVLLLGMQWTSGAERDESAHRLEVLLRRAAARLPGVRCLGLSLPGPGKPRTLNAGIAIAEELGCAGVGWVDDDVTLDPGALARLTDAFRAAGCRGAVGATKIPHTKAYATSRLLARAKEIATPATSYPHGCCILVATDVVAGGLPGRYISDDGYVCFRLLAPGESDPLVRLRLVPDAICHYYVAGPAGETRRRVRRLLLNHLVDLADWPLPAARHYFRRVLFAGMWPLTGWDGSRGRRIGVQKAAIAWIYFGWFAGVAAELYVRGVTGRPLRRIEWAPYSSVPAPATGPLSAGTAPTA